MKTWNKGWQSYYVGIPKFEILYWHKSYNYFLIKVKNDENSHWELWKNYYLKKPEGYFPPKQLVVFTSSVRFDDAKYWFENSKYNKEV